MPKTQTFQVAENLDEILSFMKENKPKKHLSKRQNDLLLIENIKSFLTYQEDFLTRVADVFEPITYLKHSKIPLINSQQN